MAIVKVLFVIYKLLIWIFIMPKAFKRFLKKLPKNIQTIKYTFREFLSSKIWNRFCFSKFLVSILLIKHSLKSWILNYIKFAIYEILWSKEFLRYSF